jgi:hypothetical protein
MKKTAILAVLCMAALAGPVVAGADELDDMLDDMVGKLEMFLVTVNLWMTETPDFLESAAKLSELCSDREHREVVYPFRYIQPSLMVLSQNIGASIRAFERLYSDPAVRRNHTDDLVDVYITYRTVIKHWEELRAEYDALLEKLNYLAFKYHFQL